MSDKVSDDRVQGEGNHTAAGRLRDAEKFVNDGPVEQKAGGADDALDRPEAGDIEAARRSTAAGDVRGRERGPRPDGSQPHDARLDERLKETFPASDPASVSPGSD